MSEPLRDVLAKPAHLEARDWLAANLENATTAIADQVLERDPDIPARYRSRTGTRKCTEDIAYHLHYLLEALANNSPSIFTTYLGWAKIVLASRDIAVDDLACTLQETSSFFQQAPEPARDALLRFVQLSLDELPRLPEQAPTFIDPQQPFSDLASLYLNHLLLFRRNEAASLISTEIERGLSIRELFEHVIRPVQEEVGRLWQQNTITVLQEHYSTAATEWLLASLQRRFLGSTRTVTALAVCPPGEQHCVALRLFADLLEADGWTVIYAGANCPHSDVLRQLQYQEIDLVAISVATPLSCENARNLLAAIRANAHDHVPAVLAGGAAFWNYRDLAAGLGADAVAHTVTQGLHVANQLVANRSKQRHR